VRRRGYHNNGAIPPDTLAIAPCRKSVTAGRALSRAAAAGCGQTRQPTGRPGGRWSSACTSGPRTLTRLVSDQA